MTVEIWYLRRRAILVTSRGGMAEATAEREVSVEERGRTTGRVLVVYLGKSIGRVN